MSNYWFSIVYPGRVASRHINQATKRSINTRRTESMIAKALPGIFSLIMLSTVAYLWGVIPFNIICLTTLTKSGLAKWREK